MKKLSTFSFIIFLILLTVPALADFRIYGSAGGNELNDPASIVFSNVADPGSFDIAGSNPDPDNVDFHLNGTYTDPDLDWTNDLFFSADVSDGEIGAALLSHTNAPGLNRAGPFSMIDVSMWDIFHIEPGPGRALGDPVEINLLSNWTGHILLEGSPSGGSYVGYSATYFLGSGGSYGNILGGLTSIDSSLYPPMDNMVDRSLDEIVTVHVGDSISVYQQISFDLNGSAYSGATTPSGDNDLDFLDAGWAGLGYAPGYKDLNIWSDAGAAIVPEPISSILFVIGGTLLAGRRYMKRRKKA